MTTECPYCATAGYLDAFTKGKAEEITIRLPYYVRQARFFHESARKFNKHVTAKAERRGRKLLIPFYGKDLAPAWREFKVEVFGLETGLSDSIYPPSEGRNMAQPPLFSEADVEAKVNRQFFALRVTHQKHPLVLTAHWWPTHGRRVELRGPLSEDNPNTDIEVIRKAFGFFQRDERGAPKITEADIRKAVQEIGPDAQQLEVARRMKVTEQGLIKWRTRHGLNSWQEVLNQYAN